MKRELLAAALCAAAITSASSAQAITLTFDWEAVSGSSSTDETVTASGTMDIDAAAGESFGLDDLTGISLSVRGAMIVDFTIDAVSQVAALAGEIAPDGMSARLNDFFAGGMDTPFGCDFPGCGQTDATGEEFDWNIASGRDPDGELVKTAYLSAGDALGSFVLERLPETDTPAPAPEVIPLPASAPLLLCGLGALVWWRRRQRRTVA